MLCCGASKTALQVTSHKSWQCLHGASSAGSLSAQDVEACFPPTRFQCFGQPQGPVRDLLQVQSHCRKPALGQCLVESWEQGHPLDVRHQYAMSAWKSCRHKTPTHQICVQASQSCGDKGPTPVCPEDETLTQRRLFSRFKI